ncbi:MAG TPA: hypothetical protein VFU31_15950 [Candidatus Binatia bacterium]|nr:hypothetical protein [Candidatus Binatia bacterium]
MKARIRVVTLLLGAVTLSVPAYVAAQGADRPRDKDRLESPKDIGDSNRYSDRDRERSSRDEKKALEQALKTGESKDSYRRQLEKMGWQITSINYDKPDYVEYEIVKGNSTYEVQIDFDKNSNKAKQVDVSANAWKAEATQRALKGEKVEGSKKAAANGSRYSDRDRMKSARNEEQKLEQALKRGQDKDFYRRELEKMGWQITSVNYDKPDYVEYEIVKGNSSYEVQIDFDKDSRKATKVDVAVNAWKAEATERALDRRKQEQARR